MKGGFGGIGRAFSGALGMQLTPDQIRRNFLDELSSFSKYGGMDFFPSSNGGIGGELIGFLRDMRNGLYGLINIQTENDVIALRRLFVFFKKTQESRLMHESLKQEWLQAGQPEPIFGVVMKDAKNILEKASKKGLLRRVEQHEAMGGPKAGEPAEAADAVHSLNEADKARVQGTMSAADFSNIIGAITYDASPYTTSSEKKSLLPSFFRGRGGRRSRKNKKTYKNKNKRKNTTRK